MEYLKKKKIENYNLFEEQKELWIKEGNFDNFNLSEDTKNNLIKNNYKYLFPIQQKTFNSIFEGFDVIGKDRTGSGKTLAFGLPLIEKLRVSKKFTNKYPKLIVIVPTRELSIQVTNELNKLKNYEKEFEILSIYGGVNIENQISILNKGVDIIVGTPGRIIDLQSRACINNEYIESIILDETDQMLDYGFKKEIETIINNIKDESKIEHQIILFSATIPKTIKEIATTYLDKNYQFFDLIKNNEQKTSKTVEHLALFCPSNDQKIPSISDILSVYGGSHSKTLIFTDTKKEANEILLKGNLKIETNVLHGEIPQIQREVTFKSFREGKIKCLIATNLASRGLDIPKIDLILQLSPPKDIDSYIHRSGRTARTGKTGVCVTYYSNNQKDLIEKIEKKANIKFKQIGFPQPIDIIKASFDDIVKSVRAIPNDISNCFLENVDVLIEEFGVKNALAKAMVLISGQDEKIKQRSLLTAKDGYKTYILKGYYKMEKIGHYWGILKKNFSQEMVDCIRILKFLKDKEGVIFDIELQYIEEIKNFISNQSSRNAIEIYSPNELPDLEEYDKNMRNLKNTKNNFNRFDNNKFNRKDNNFNNNNQNKFYNNNKNVKIFNRFQNNNNLDNNNPYFNNQNNFNKNNNVPPVNFNYNGFNNFNNNGLMNFNNNGFANFNGPNNFNNMNNNMNNNMINNNNKFKKNENNNKFNKNENLSKNKTKLFINNINYKVKDEDIINFFKENEIEISNLFLDSSKGFGICFVNKNNLNDSLDLNGSNLFGRNINIKIAKNN